MTIKHPKNKCTLVFTISATAVPTGIQNVECSIRNLRNTLPEKPYQCDPVNLEKNSQMLPIKSRTTNRTRHKRSRSEIMRQPPCKKGSSVSLAEIKRRIKGLPKERKLKLVPHPPFNVDARIKKKITVVKPLDVNKTYTVIGDSIINTPQEMKGNEPIKSDKIIELYHNSAVHMVTASDDSLAMNKKIKEQNALKQQAYNIKPFKEPEDLKKPPVNITPTNAYVPNIASNQCPQMSTMFARRIGDGVSPPYSRSYELPTIASKMKQVAKNYFQNFTFRTIPFVVARSTSPSHNLGINIQQVLSIMKGRKPVQGISPTLAYNIELAANKLGSRPFSALVSNLGSRLTSRCMCPAARRFNFAQLQEQAKNSVIPEDGNESQIDMNCRSETYEKNYESSKNVPEKSWSIDPNKRIDQCNCLPRRGVNFNDVCCKYINDGQAYVSTF